jgi:zinc transport system permease protein
VGVAILALYGLMHKEIQLVLFDRELAVASGVPAGLVYDALLVCVCLAIAAAIRVTGALLVDAVTILPALAATRLGSNLAQIVFYAAGFGLAGNLAGLFVAYQLDLPVSTAVILAAAAILTLTMVTRRGT